MHLAASDPIKHALPSLHVTSMGVPTVHFHQQNLLLIRMKSSFLAMLQEASNAEGQLVRLALTSRYCAALMPDGGPDAQARIHLLEAELHSMESELAEADAQHRLYNLLEERTRSVSMLSASLLRHQKY